MIQRITVSVVRMPMQRSFGHARAVRSVAENVFLTVQFDDATGIGECAPREYVTGESIDSVCTALTQLDVCAMAERMRVGNFEDGVRSIEALKLPWLVGRRRAMPAAACALELALLDALGRRFGRPLTDISHVLGLPEPLAEQGTGPFEVTRVLDFSADVDAFLDPGTATHRVKVKVGRDMAEDIARVRRLRNALGPGTPIAVDANMAWSFEDAIRAAEQLAPLGIAWYEEPLRDNHFAELRRFRDVTGERVMLDEALSSLDDARRAVEAQACDLINIRVSKCGGLIASLRLAEFAYHNGLQFQIGVQVGEMGALWAGGRQLMAAVGGAVAYEAGQGDLLFSHHVIAPRPPIDRTTYLADRLPGPGLGVTLQPAVWRHVVRHHVWTRVGAEWNVESPRMEMVQQTGGRQSRPGHQRSSSRQAPCAPFLRKLGG